MSNETVQAMAKSASLDEAKKAWKEGDTSASEQVYTELCELVEESDCQWIPDAPNADADEDRLVERACVAGDKALVEFLMEIGGKDILLKSKSALYYAIDNDHTELAKFIIDQGYDVQTSQSEGDFGPFPIHAACHNDSLEMVELLLEKGSKPDLAIADYNRLPIHIAGEKKNLDIVRKLVEAGAPHQIFEEDNSATKAISLAEDDEELLKFFLDHIPEDFKWEGDVGFPEIELKESIPYETRTRCLSTLARIGYLKEANDFTRSVKASGCSLADVTDVADLFPSVEFPPRSKAAKE